jgi:hypothetical protein
MHVILFEELGMKKQFVFYNKRVTTIGKYIRWFTTVLLFIPIVLFSGLLGAVSRVNPHI